MFVVRKHADKSGGRRVVKYDPETGARKLVNPDTAGDLHEPWPLAGVSIRHLPDDGVIQLSTNFVENGKAEGWLDTEGDRVVFRPAGPADDPLNGKHTFVHFDVLTVHTIDGDVRFRVTRQPDKYADYAEATYPDAVKKFKAGDDTAVTPEIYAAGATRVDWFYVLKAEGEKR